MAKAEELSKELDATVEWTCSNGWLSRWKGQHNIKQAHYAFLDIQAFLLRSHGHSSTEVPYRLLANLEIEFYKAGNNSHTQTSITDYFSDM